MNISIAFKLGLFIFANFVIEKEWSAQWPTTIIHVIPIPGENCRPHVMSHRLEIFEKHSKRVANLQLFKYNVIESVSFDLSANYDQAMLKLNDFSYLTGLSYHPYPLFIYTVNILNLSKSTMSTWQK